MVIDASEVRRQLMERRGVLLDGKCIACGEAIANARLLARAETPYCTPCAEASEAHESAAR